MITFFRLLLHRPLDKIGQHQDVYAPVLGHVLQRLSVTSGADMEHGLGLNVIEPNKADLGREGRGSGMGSLEEMAHVDEISAGTILSACILKKIREGNGPLWSGPYRNGLEKSGTKA